MLKHVAFYPLSYERLPIPPRSIIYCDPPYNGVTGYGIEFDSKAFYDWCRVKAADGHAVYVSEYSAPKDFVCVWQKPVTSSLNAHRAHKHKPATEKLFKVLA